jgi:outer membrane protein OmpA-like peptidoglycan-associated protein
MLSHMKLGGAVGLITLPLLTTAASLAQAGEVVLYNAGPPSAAEIADVMFPKAGQKATYAKTRGIRFTTEDATAAAPPVSSLGTTTAVASNEPSAAPPRAPEGAAIGFNIRFALDSAELMPDARPYLDRVGEALRSEAKDGQVVIVGHTDARGAADYNQTLSERRALAVQAYLVEHWQVAPDRLRVVGEGKKNPLPGLDPLNGANRRVEFHPAG